MLSFIKNIIFFLTMSASSIFLSPASTNNEQKTDPPVITKKKKVHSQNYPIGAFRNPLDIPVDLVANFGELRPNHYHMGLDIRTMQRENLPVFAAADGYVRKIKIEPGGFGNAIYIEHFNGYTTLYAHLNSFYPALAAYIKQVQYRTQQWEQELEIDPELFPVTKGTFIGLSGNTGGSQGPHLHFEIRDTETGNNLNPLLFGFAPEDITPPAVYNLYYYDRRYSTYQSGPVSIPIKGTTSHLTSQAAVVSVKSPIISFGIKAEDAITRMHGRVGIYQAEVWMDEVLQSGFTMDDISYDETRYINGSIDYKTKLAGGPYIQHLSRLPGNHGSYFFENSNSTISLKDTAIHRVKIIVKDVAGNQKQIAFAIKWNPVTTVENPYSFNTIMMPVDKENIFENEQIKVMFSSRAFYDNMPFTYHASKINDPDAVSVLHQLCNYTYPVHDYYTVQINPDKTIPQHLQNKVVVHLQSKKREELVKGEWVNGKVQARFRYLGEIKVLLDTTPPVISPYGWVNGNYIGNKKTISILAKDNLEEIKSFNAFLDGQWILFEYGKGVYYYTVDNKMTPGRHELKIVVADEAGNIAEKIFFINR